MLRESQEQRRQRASTLSRSPHGLLAPLNHARQPRRTRDLVDLVRTLQEIERIEIALTWVELQLRKEPNYLADDGPHRAPSRLYAYANEILSTCHWSPRVASPPNESYSFTWNARTEQTDWENRFVLWVLNLRARGDLSLIRCCRNCGQWFYAITNHQTSCSDRCRQQFHSKDKRFKENRRLYMRRYRKAERERESAEIGRHSTEMPKLKGR
jgi:hypothetical protein